MYPFDHFSVPRIAFGRGKVAALADLAAPLGPTVLVVHNGGDRPLAAVADAVKPTGATLVPHRQRGEPTVADVDAALAAARRAGCTGVIGVGG
ncbi:MAG TPA: iron-containing alcohol dehydrogenase, partial [Humisphaera sp.]